MQIAKQLELAAKRYKQVKRYLDLSDIQDKSVEDILDKLLENDQVASSGEYDHEYAYIQLLIECEFHYDFATSENIFCNLRNIGWLEFDVEEDRWF